MLALSKKLFLLFAMLAVCNFFAAAVYAKEDLSPDALFPEQSQQGLLVAHEEMGQVARLREAAATDPSLWELPEVKDMPVTYSSFIILKKEIDALKAKIEASSPK